MSEPVMSEIAIDSSPMVDEPREPGVIDSNDDYDRLLVDLWVGVVLTLMVLSCVGCLCTCFLYHTFKQWQRRVSEAQRIEAHMEAAYDTESLPSYTVVAGLPSYEEAIEQLKQGAAQQNEASQSETDSSAPVFSRLSVGDLLEIYKVDVKK